MTIQVTPEVASAHKNLQELCERFEASVDEFCASPLQSIRTKDFYESECVPIAVECGDALSKFQSARSYEITECDQTVAEADNTLRQQKRELEENAEQRAKVYESKIAKADSTLRQQKRKLEENAAQSIKTCENAVAEEEDTLRQQKRKLEENAAQRTKTYEGAIAEDDDTLLQQKRELEEDTTSKIRGVESEVEQFSDVAKYVGLSLSLTETARKSESKISYHKALNAAKNFCTPPISWKYFKKKRITETLQTLQSAAIEECNSIQKANQNEVKKVLAAHEEKVSELQAWKEQEDIQAAESAAKALAAHEERLKAAREKKNQAIVYIQQEYQAFDTRLCQCIDRFQLVVDTWVTENANATSVLNKDRLQDLNRNSEEIGSCLTRVGTVGIWDLSDKTSKPVTTVQAMKHTDDTQAVKRYLNTIANAEITTQPIEYTDDTQAVKHYLNIIANGQRNNKVQKNLERMAEQGNTEAQFTLGGIYENGINVQKNETEAVNWYKKAAESGHKQALKNLTKMAEQGNTEAVNWYRKAAESGHKQALKNLTKIAEQGNTEAQFSLGDMYKKGRGVQKNRGVAVNWYRKAAEQGNTEAQFSLGDMYEKGRGVEKNETEAAKWYRKAAEQGHALAKGGLTDFERLKAAEEQRLKAAAEHRKAAAEHRKAAESGNVDAQYQLAVMYQNGQGVHKSDYEAKEWYQKAAEQGHADAQYQLACLSDDLLLFQSMELYVKAAEQGHADAQEYLSNIEDPEAQYQIGNTYYHEMDDEYLACEWYQKAAEQGHVQAQRDLGRMYEMGWGVERDGDQAAEWHAEIREQAEQGNAEAQYTLGEMFQYGDFITGYGDDTQNRRLAVKWYQQAAEQGYTPAEEALRRIEKRR